MSTINTTLSYINYQYINTHISNHRHCIFYNNLNFIVPQAALLTIKHVLLSVICYQ